MDSEEHISYKLPYCKNTKSPAKFYEVYLSIEEYNRILFGKPPGSIVCPTCGGNGQQMGINSANERCFCKCPLCEGKQSITWIQNIFGDQL